MSKVNPGKNADLTDFMTVEEAATAMGRHTHTIRRWIKEGRVIGQKSHGRVFVHKDELTGVFVRGLNPRVTHQDIEVLKAEVGRLKDTVAMLLDELGYGTSYDGVGQEALEQMVNQSTRALASPGWTHKERSEFADFVMRIRDDDLRFLALGTLDNWKPLYLLLLAMRKVSRGTQEKDRLVRTKLDRAIDHLRSVVVIVAKTTTRSSKIRKQMERVVREMGADPEPTTRRLLDWIDREMAPAA